MTREIPLTQGQVAIVDEADFESINDFKWCARWSKSTKTFYAIRGEKVNGKDRTVLMHRQIMGVAYGDPRTVDHRSPALTLVNTRDNLRIATKAQNGANARRHRTNTRGFKGVTFNRRTATWRAYIYEGRKQINLGLHSTPHLAHAAYAEAALARRGEFARTNWKGEPQWRYLTHTHFSTQADFLRLIF
jgi:hypothetical protein